MNKFNPPEGGTTEMLPYRIYTEEERRGMTSEQERYILKYDLVVHLSEQILCSSHEPGPERENIAAQGIGRLLDYLWETGDRDIAVRVWAMMSGYFPKATDARGNMYCDEFGHFLDREGNRVARWEALTDHEDWRI